MHVVVIMVVNLIVAAKAGSLSAQDSTSINLAMIFTLLMCLISPSSLLSFQIDHTYSYAMIAGMV
jgi:hypothetical protein